MTRNGPRGPKKRARSRQQRDGEGKYTRALRNAGESSAADAAPAQEADGLSFALADLISECLTTPEEAWEPWDDHLVWGFRSTVLGCLVPAGAVLTLAGAMAGSGPRARLAAEHVSQEYAHLRSESSGQRWHVGFDCAVVAPLCTVVGCTAWPADANTIPCCREHLASLCVGELVRMGNDWARGVREEHDYKPEGVGNQPKAVWIVQAAVPQGAATFVIQQLLDHLFEEEDMIDEVVGDEVEAMGIRHAIAKERRRLQQAAGDEAQRLRKAAAVCACGREIPGYYSWANQPPHVCSSACTPEVSCSCYGCAQWSRHLARLKGGRPPQTAPVP